MKAKVISFAGKGGSEATLAENIFGLPIRKDILQRVVEWQRAKKQAGTHKTQSVGEVTGTTAKPFKQKGTGNARQGNKKSPHMRGGAVAHGPKVRSHAHDLPKNIRKLGLKTALSAKQSEGKLHILDTTKLKTPKSADLAKNIEKHGLTSALFIDGDEVDANFLKASGNLKFIDALPSQGANVYDILKHENLVLTVDAIKKLEERLA